MLADQNWKDEFSDLVIYQIGEPLPGQTEKEYSNIPIDWRKRAVFEAVLEPSQMNRFDARVKALPEKPKLLTNVENGHIRIIRDGYSAKINVNTGFLDSYVTCGKERLNAGAGKILVISDNEDPWGMTVQGFNDIIGSFSLASPEETAEICGIDSKTLPPVRVVEDGAVRTVIEAVFKYSNSHAVIRYNFNRNNSEIRLNVRVINVEKSVAMKLSFPSTLTNAYYMGKTSFGVDDLRSDGNETVAQDFVLLTDKNDAFSVINTGTYGSSCLDGEIRMTLLRSAAYCAHPIGGRKTLPQDRFNERIDQGERIFDFYINASDFASRMENIEKESALIHEKPYAVCFFPSSSGQKPSELIRVDNPVMRLVAFKRSNDGDGYIARFFNPDIKQCAANIEIPVLKAFFAVKANPYGVKTYKINSDGIIECDMCENAIDKAGR